MLPKISKRNLLLQPRQSKKTKHKRCFPVSSAGHWLNYLEFRQRKVHMRKRHFCWRIMFTSNENMEHK